jgi:hypothetical protein
MAMFYIKSNLVFLEIKLFLLDCRLFSCRTCEPIVNYFVFAGRIKTVLSKTKLDDSKLLDEKLLDAKSPPQIDISPIKPYKEVQVAE